MSDNILNTLLANLKPQLIDNTKCTPKTSLKEQLNKAAATTNALDRQKQQYNMGSGQMFTDPVKAAEYLLQREYGDTHLFGHKQKQPIFIPASFISDGLHKEENAILDFDIMNEFHRIRKNLSSNDPSFWLTKEVQIFVEQANDDFKIKDLNLWLLKINILNLIHDIRPNIDEELLPNSIEDITDFIKQCADVLQKLDTQNNLSIDLQKFVQSADVEDVRKIEKWVDKLEKKHRPKYNATLKWFNDLEMTKISGEEAEHFVYNSLQDTIKETDFVVLHGCNFFVDVEKKRRQEIDFMLLSAERKIIIIIECKFSFNEHTSIKASKQLQKYKKIIEERLGDQLDSDWQYIPIVYFHKSDTIPTQLHQSDFLISVTTDFMKWWQNICFRFPQSYVQDTDAFEQMRNVLKPLLFIFHFSRALLGSLKGCATVSKIVEEITKAVEVVSTPSNIVFYSANQLPVMVSGDQRYKRVNFMAGYGAGKTFLLREKAGMLAQNGEKVAFLMASPKTSEAKTLLQIKLESYWSNPKFQRNIIVITPRDVTGGGFFGQELTPEHLLVFIKNNPNLHLMIDEWSIPINQYNELQKCGKDLRDCVAEIKDRCLWVAWHRDTSFQLLQEYEFSDDNEVDDDSDWDSDDDIDDKDSNEVEDEWIKSCKEFRSIIDDLFYKLDLKYSFRSSTKIIEAAKRSTDLVITIPPQNFPLGIEPTHYKITDYDSQPTVQSLMSNAFATAKKLTNRGIIVLVSSALKTNEFLTLINTVIGEHKTESVSAYFVKREWRKHSFGSHMEFLKNNEGILITDDQSAEGFEWPTIITYGARMDFSVNTCTRCNHYMRCISNLITIHE